MGHEEEEDRKEEEGDIREMGSTEEEKKVCGASFGSTRVSYRRPPDLVERVLPLQLGLGPLLARPLLCNVRLHHQVTKRMMTHYSIVQLQDRFRLWQTRT
jgi:hypothetical protein